ncbi:MAG: chromate transporter [Ginsengibacter sp.]
MVKKMGNSTLFSAFLDVVNVASVTIIISICFIMGKNSFTDWRTIVITVISIGLTLGYRKINSAFIVLGGSLLGYFLALL